MATDPRDLLEDEDTNSSAFQAVKWALETSMRGSVGRVNAAYSYEEASPRKRHWAVVYGGGAAAPVAIATYWYEQGELSQKFSQLADRWAEETRSISAVQTKSMNLAYQQVIGMGRQAIPLILERLRDTREHWFWALRAITGLDAAAGETSVDGAVQAWVEWGERQGFINSL